MSPLWGHVGAILCCLAFSWLAAYIALFDGGPEQRTFYAAISGCLLALSGTWYFPIVRGINNAIDGTGFQKSYHTYADAFSLAIFLTALHFFIRVGASTLLRFLRDMPYFVCLRGCGRRAFFIGSNTFVYGAPATTPNYSLPSIVTGLVFIHIVWPTLFLIGLVMGGLLILKSPTLYWAKSAIVVIGSTIWMIVLEMFVVLSIKTPIIWKTEWEYIHYLITRDAVAIAFGFFVAWCVFRRLRTNDLTRLRTLLALIPPAERRSTITALEDLLEK